MKNLYLLRSVGTLLIIILCLESGAQTFLNDDGGVHTINYSGSAETLRLPNNPNIAGIRFTLRGGGGGYARVEDSFIEYIPPFTFNTITVSCKANGASGASVNGTYSVGSGIQPGSDIRFIVGGRGTNDSSDGSAGFGSAAGGGGGGSAVLTKSPGSSSWTIRMVASGGGGAYQDMAAYICGTSSDGKVGRSSSFGGDGGGITGGDGGTFGNGGSGSEFAGAGGGANSSGGGITCIGLSGTTTAGEGGSGGTSGGSGGDSDGCTNFSWSNGGFGFGGGGAGTAAGGGGGGGGYSGGGAGGTLSAGGGGGSYLLYSGLSNSSTADGFTTGSPSNGYITYQIILNEPPVARCRNRTLTLNSSGYVSISPWDINNGSSDADGFIASSSVSPSILYCSSIGRTETVTLTVTDNDGATSTCTAQVTIQDRINPVLITKNYVASLSGSSITIGNGAVVQFVRDNCSSSSISLSKRTFTCTDVGTNSITVTATDASGNQTRRTALVNVVDTRKPTANCVDMVAQLDASGLATVSPSIIGAGSFDNCGIKSRTLSKTDFDCTDVGIPQTVTLTVTDVNNNVSTCTSTVTVVDNVKPTAICKNFTLQLNANGLGTLNPSDIDAGSFDNCGVQSIAVSRSSFTCDDVGTPQLVDLIVTDVNGNVRTCTTTVTVEDNVAPEALCMDKTIELDINGNASISVTDIDNGSNDACGIADRSLNMLDFDCSHVGDNTVTLTVTDVNGNIDECTATVTVEDNIAPTFAVTQSITLWPPNHEYHTIDVLNYIDVASIYDNCGGIGLNDINVSQVSSDEAENDDDDGNTTEDMVIAAGCQSVDLRAERSGADGANGRVYTITLALEDVNGNTGFADLSVMIPVGKQDQAVDDGSIGYVVSCANENARLGTELPVDTEVGELGIYPNPFNAHVTIDYKATHSERIELTLFSLTGAAVGRVYEGSVEMGQSYRWRYEAPADLAEGILILRVKGEDYAVDRKLLFRR